MKKPEESFIGVYFGNYHKTFDAISIWWTIRKNLYEEGYNDARIRQHYWVRDAIKCYDIVYKALYFDISRRYSCITLSFQR